MKVLVVSDIHGSIESAQEIERLINKENPEKILILGDFLYNGPRNGVKSDYDPMAVANILNKYADKIVACRGNCDADIDLDMLSFPIPKINEIFLFNHRFIMVHGDDVSKDLLSLKSGDIVVYGHYHIPVIRVYQGILFLNPGSITFPKTDDKIPTYIILEDGKINLYKKCEKLVVSKAIDELIK